MKIIDSKNYVDKARTVIERLKEYKNNRGKEELLTTSQIRSILAMTADIYNDVIVLTDETLTDRINEKLGYLRIRCIYEAGRDELVKRFVKHSQLLEGLSEVDNRKDYILFSHYVESLVAWHRYMGGRDN